MYDTILQPTTTVHKHDSTNSFPVNLNNEHTLNWSRSSYCLGEHVSALFGYDRVKMVYVHALQQTYRVHDINLEREVAAGDVH